MKPLQFYYSCLPASLLVYQHSVVFWLKLFNSNNLAVHALANCCKDSIIGTLFMFSVMLLQSDKSISNDNNNSRYSSDAVIIMAQCTFRNIYL